MNTSAIFNNISKAVLFVTVAVLPTVVLAQSPISFIRSPFGWGLIVVMYLLAGLFGLIYRALLKRFATGSVRTLNKNIGKSDRVLRLVFGLGLLLFAILTTWSPIIIFFSGFCIFESLFSWCGFYAAIGKNTCPIE